MQSDYVMIQGKNEKKKVKGHLGKIENVGHPPTPSIKYASFQRRRDPHQNHSHTTQSKERKRGVITIEPFQKHQKEMGNWKNPPEG